MAGGATYSADSGSAGAGVVQLYGTFEDERHVSLVMEHCTAGDLFKTMLVHGGVLDEHWVAIQVRGESFGKLSHADVATATSATGNL